MNDSATSTPYTEFVARLRADGFAVSEAAAQQMWDALPHLNALRQRVRRDLAPTDEPAHTFSPARQGQPKRSSS